MARMFTPWLGVAAVVVALLAGTRSAPPAIAAERVIVVNDGGDNTHSCSFSGLEQCSLRDAIAFANGSDGHDTITFDLPPSLVHTIRPTTALPALSDPAGVTIDAYTQDEASANSLPEGTNAVLKLQLDGIFAAGASGFTLSSGGNEIRGFAITNFYGAGVKVTGGAGNVIAGNFIGVEPDGSPAANSTGVTVLNSTSSTTIGGLPAAARNLISSNMGNGIEVMDNANETIIVGNLIGTHANGLTGTGNAGWGIEILDEVTDTIVGGNLEAGNTLAFNAGGVRVDGSSSRNMIIANRLFSNSGPGIDLGQDGSSQNDEFDNDLGPNFLQNYPVLQTAMVSPVTSEVLVTGMQDSDDLSGINRIDIYIADASVTGVHGEGRNWIGFEGGQHSAGFEFEIGPFAPAAEVLSSNRLTATATSNDGTSEFAANIPVLLNARPIAQAGADQVVAPKILVALVGSGSIDPDGLPAGLEFHWTQVGGHPVALSSKNEPMPGFTPTQGGVYTFRLTVSDGLDTSLADEVSVSIIDYNAPVAKDITATGVGGSPQSVRLGATDAEATLFTFKIVDPPQHGTLTGLNPQTGTVIYTASSAFSGTDTFTYRAFDGSNTSDPGTVTITIKGGLTITTPILPAATIATPYTFSLGASGGSGHYTWSFTGGQIPPGMTFAGGTLSGISILPGDYSFSVQATDSSGLKTARSVRVSVSEAGRMPFRLFAMFTAAN